MYRRSQEIPHKRTTKHTKQHSHLRLECIRKNQAAHTHSYTRQDQTHRGTQHGQEHTLQTQILRITGRRGEEGRMIRAAQGSAAKTSGAEPRDAASLAPPAAADGATAERGERAQIHRKARPEGQGRGRFRCRCERRPCWNQASPGFQQRRQPSQRRQGWQRPHAPSANAATRTARAGADARGRATSDAHAPAPAP